MKCALRVRVLQKGESSTMCRGARRATLLSPARTVNVMPMSRAWRGRGPPDNKSSRSRWSNRSDDHGDGVKSRSGRAGTAKRLSLQPPARSSNAHSTTQGARPRTSTRQQQRQGAVVASPCCSLSGGASAAPQAFCAPGSKVVGTTAKKSDERRVMPDDAEP
jgi:hypothetical protein